MIGGRDVPRYRGQSSTVTSMAADFRTLTDLPQDKRDIVAARPSYQPTAGRATLKYFIRLNSDV